MDTKLAYKMHRIQGDTALRKVQQADRRRENLRRGEKKMLPRVLTRADKRKLRQQERETADLQRYRSEWGVEIIKFQQDTRAFEEQTTNYLKQREDQMQTLVRICEQFDMKDEQYIDRRTPASQTQGLVSLLQDCWTIY